jgi:hypothetical protein
MTRGLVLDAGALIALDRNDRSTWALLAVVSREGGVVQVPAGALAQAWRRGGPPQALLGRALAHCDEVPLDGLAARATGMLCARAGHADVVDGSVVVAAAGMAERTDATVLTSDPRDLRRLVDAIGARIRIVKV